MAIAGEKNKYRAIVKQQLGDAELFESINSTQISPPYRIKGTMSRNAFGDTTANIIDGIDSLLESGDIIKTDRATTVAKTRISDRDVIIKRYNNQGFLNSLKYTLAGSRARRVWRETHLLQQLNIATPTALGYFDVLHKGRVIRSYLINEFCPEPILHYLLLDKLIPITDWPKIVELVRELLCDLHGKGVTHGDIKHSNIIYERGKLILIDLDSLIIHRSKKSLQRHIKKDLSAFERKINSDPEEYIKRKKIELNISD
ncbi:MAG: protein kinase family protein [Porticoccaceae bacterium]|nr:protein kinase family protein [Porticoccaceae bacterium]